MKLVTKINEKISIYADENQFVVKIRSKQNKRLDKQQIECPELIIKQVEQLLQAYN